MAGTTVVLPWLTTRLAQLCDAGGFFTVVMGVLRRAAATFMLRHGGRNFPVRLVEVMLGLHMLVLGVRLGSILAGHAGSDPVEPSLFRPCTSAYALTRAHAVHWRGADGHHDRLRAELEHLAT